MCEKRLNNGYETHQTAFYSMIGHIGKLNCYNDHRIYEMLPFNVTIETSVKQAWKTLWCPLFLVRWDILNRHMNGNLN